MPEYILPRDTDTEQKGLSGPFEPYEADSTGLRHVLLEATRRYGFTVEKDFDEIAGMIRRSRWLAATKHFAQFSWFAPHLGHVTEDPKTYWALIGDQAPPFKYWETDQRSLVSAIWRSDGFTPDDGRVVEAIMNSRWYAAVIAENRIPADAGGETHNPSAGQ